MSRLYWTSPAAHDALYADTAPTGQVSELQLAAFVELNPPGSGAPLPGELTRVTFDTLVLCRGDPARLAWLTDRSIIEATSGRFQFTDPEGFRRRWWPTVAERLSDAVAAGDHAGGLQIMDQLRSEGWTWAQLSAVSHGPDADRTAAHVWYRRARSNPEHRPKGTR